MNQIELVALGERVTAFTRKMIEGDRSVFTFETIRQLAVDALEAVAVAHNLLADLEECGCGYSEDQEFNDPDEEDAETEAEAA